MEQTGLRDALIQRLLCIGEAQATPRAYKDAFDELLEMMDELDELGEQSGLSIAEREQVNRVFVEIEHVRCMPAGDQFFFPSQLRSALEWQPMRDVAIEVAAQLASA